MATVPSGAHVCRADSSLGWGTGPPRGPTEPPPVWGPKSLHLGSHLAMTNLFQLNFVFCMRQDWKFITIFLRVISGPVC